MLWAIMSLSELDYQFVTQLVLDKAGVVIPPDKRDFAIMRVRECAKKANFGTESILVEHLRSSNYSRLHRQLIEELVDDETHFFRDFPVFKYMRHTAIPAILERHDTDRKLTIWCGACSSGQEAYSISIMVKEAIPQLKDWKVRIIGSDMSRRLLDKAAEGIYTQQEVSRGLPAPLLLKHFEKDVTKWAIKPDHKERVEFRQIALNGSWEVLPGKWDEKPVFDIIFLRNVLSYFNRKIRKELLRKLPNHMHPGTFLILGKGEEPGDNGKIFEPIDEALGIYRLKADAEIPAAPPAPEPSQEVSAQPAAAAASVPAAAPAAASSATGEDRVLVTFRYKALQTVVDMLLRDLDPEAHVYIGLKNEPPPSQGLFQVVDTIPESAKKKGSDGDS